MHTAVEKKDTKYDLDKQHYMAIRAVAIEYFSNRVFQRKFHRLIE